VAGVLYTAASPGVAFGYATLLMIASLIALAATVRFA